MSARDKHHRILAGSLAQPVSIEAHDVDGDGVLNFAEYCAMVRARTPDVEHTEDLLKEKFRWLDVDSSGTVDVHEILRSIICDKLGTMQVRAVDLFRRWDEDASGSVTKNEFRKALKAIGFLDYPDADLDGVFDLLDTDGSEKLEYAELAELLKTTNKRKTILRRGYVKPQPPPEPLPEPMPCQVCPGLQIRLAAAENALAVAERALAEWETRAKKWSETDALRVKQLQDGRAERQEIRRALVDEHERARSAWQDEREALIVEHRRARSEWESERAAIVGDFERAQAAWQDEWTTLLARLAQHEEDDERMRTHQTMRLQLASAIIHTATNDNERGDSVHFWQSRKLPWRSSPGSGDGDDDGGSSQLALTNSADRATGAGNIGPYNQEVPPVSFAGTSERCYPIAPPPFHEHMHPLSPQSASAPQTLQQGGVMGHITSPFDCYQYPSPSHHQTAAPVGGIAEGRSKAAKALEHMQELTALLDMSLITEDEFDARRSSILESV